MTFGDSNPDPGAPLVFDDARPRDRHEPDHPELPPRSRMDRAQRNALDSMNRRPRRGMTVTVVAAAVVVLLAVLAVVGSQRSPKHNSGASTRSSTRATAHPTASTGSGRTNRHRSSSTTVPSQLVPQSSTAASALYTVGPSSYRLTLAASGPCWVDATSQSTGSTLWTGTMQSGSTQDIQATGATRVEFGTLAVTVTLDGSTVQIPSSLHSPFALTFEPSGSAPVSPSTAGGTSSSTAPSG